jgi:hypothetical protein
VEKLRLRIAWQVARKDAREIDARRINDVVGTPKASVWVIGAAPAELLTGLRDFGHTVSSLELSHEGPRRDTIPGISHANVSLDALTSNPVETPHDAIVSIQTLERCRDPHATIQAVRRWLVPGGVLFVEVPNHACYSAWRYGASWLLCDPFRTLNYFTAKSLTVLLNAEGFEVEDCLYRQYLPQFSRARLSADQASWDAVYAQADTTDHPPPRKSPLNLWTDLLRTMRCRPEEKFEILGIVARTRG